MVMAHNGPAEDRAAKRKLGTEEETPKAESEAVAKQGESAQMLSKMFDKLDQKDQQITKMLETIAGLRAEIRILNERLAHMQTKGADEDKDI